MIPARYNLRMKILWACLIVGLVTVACTGTGTKADPLSSDGSSPAIADGPSAAIESEVPTATHSPATQPEAPQATPSPMTPPEAPQSAPSPVTPPEAPQATPSPVTESAAVQATHSPATQPAVLQATPSPVTPPEAPQFAPAPAIITPLPTATHVPVSVPLARMKVVRAFPLLSFRRIVYLTYPDDGTDRLFLALQPGQVLVFPDGQGVSLTTTFLDIVARVNDAGNEEGLLGLAFDPNYAVNDHFYVYYSASAPRRSVISRFSTSRGDANKADPDSEHIILEVPQPYSNHNGGHLVFGPDGYLYIGLGDGGKAGDPHGNGENTSTLLGSILRIDVDTIDIDGTYSVPPDNPFAGVGGGVRGEIWAYGLRNPWRFSFDRVTGELWAADVGQDEYEEVDIIEPGLNYGWNTMEGAHCFRPPSGCDREGLEMPVMEYGREGGCSVTGGYVYRGSRLPSLYGAYVYGDFCSGRIWALRHDGTQITEHLELVDSDLQISSFGEDRDGELYILSFDKKIYRLVPR